MDYEIQATRNGWAWQTQATFKKGAASRFGKPFDDEIAKMEAESFKEKRCTGKNASYKAVRLIINI